MYSFLMVFIVRPCSVSVIMLTSAEYLVEFVKTFVCIDSEEDVKWTKKLLALVGLFIITYVNAVSVKLYVKLQGVFTLLKLLACLVVIAGGIYSIVNG